MCCTVAAQTYRLLVLRTESHTAFSGGSRAVRCPGVQANALQQSTCEEDTHRVRRLTRCAAHAVVCAVQISKGNNSCATRAECCLLCAGWADGGDGCVPVMRVHVMWECLCLVDCCVGASLAAMPVCTPILKVTCTWFYVCRLGCCLGIV
jgi:hypothetical protein